MAHAFSPSAMGTYLAITLGAQTIGFVGTFLTQLLAFCLSLASSTVPPRAGTVRVLGGLAEQFTLRHNDGFVRI